MSIIRITNRYSALLTLVTKFDRSMELLSSVPLDSQTSERDALREQSAGQSLRSSRNRRPLNVSNTKNDDTRSPNRSPFSFRCTEYHLRRRRSKHVEAIRSSTRWPMNRRREPDSMTSQCSATITPSMSYELAAAAAAAAASSPSAA
jgi:hypothetical protein